jgi:hypothetical protein
MINIYLWLCTGDKEKEINEVLKKKLCDAI